MSILFTLCGRAGSKGFKNKNLKSFLGKPLVYYSVAAIALYAEKYGNKDDIDVVLNTDSEDLINLIKKQKMTDIYVIKRSEDLGGDSVPKVDVIKDCLIRSEEHFNKRYDIVVDLDITSPLRTVEDVKAAIDKKMSRNDTDVVYSVTHSRRNPYFNMVKEENNYFCKAIPSNYTARQQAPIFYDMNASIYAYSSDALRNKVSNIFFNNCCDAVIMKDTGILDIDSEEDFELMQVIGNYLYNNDEKMKVIKNYIK